MQATIPTRIIPSSAILGEGPLWSARGQELFWIDGYDPHLWHWKWGADAATVWPLARPPAALALLRDGRLLIAFRERMGIVDFPGGAIHEVEMPGLELGDERFNDAKVDRQGRFWIGTIDRTLVRPVGRLYRMDDEGITAADAGFALSNGIGWSPDSRSMYFAESYERVIHRYDFNSATGTIRRAGLLASHAGGAPKPDGLTVDAAGGIWCAIFGSSSVHRYLPDGRLDRTIRLPVSQPTSCMLGGPDLQTLFVTTATYSLTPQESARQPQAGSVFAFDVEVPGLEEPFLSPSNILLREQLTSI